MSASFNAMAEQWPLDDEATAALVGLCLAEDIGPGDVTNQALFTPEDRTKAALVAREDLCLAGLPFAAACFWAMDPDCDLTIKAKDGDALEAGSEILAVSGQTAALLSAERTALNMLQHLSGVATHTKNYRKQLAGTGAVLLDTRKTTPGLRHLEKYAVRMGGGTNHRMGLYDAIMIKDNHIAAAGSIGAAIAKAKAHSSLQIQVECDTLGQVKEALSAGADSLLLDNMTTADLKAAVALISGSVQTEASGGVTLETIHDIAKTGVDMISVGRLTQSAPAVDIGMDYSA